MSNPGVLVTHGLDAARSIDEACDIVSRLRGRPLEVVDVPLGAGVFGLWLALDEADRILVNSDAVLSERHRGHVVAHELMHVLDAHERGAAGLSVRGRTRYDDPEEHRAEALACELMMSIEASGGLADRLTGMERYQ